MTLVYDAAKRRGEYADYAARSRATGREALASFAQERCIVPGCLVRSRRLTPQGMCPPYLWDERHDRYMKEHV